MNSDSLTIDELIDKAEQLAETGAINEAIECWHSILRRKSDPILLCQFGRLATKLGRWAEAEQAFLSAIELAPELPSPYECLGLLCLERDDFELARDYFEKCVGIEENARTFTLLGVVQSQLGLMVAARGSFSKALEIDPDYEEACYNLALTFRDTQSAKAISLFEKALELDPEYSAAHRELGWSLRRLEQFPEAVCQLRRAIELDDSDGWSYIYLGNTMWVTGELASAEQAFKMGIEVWPDDSLPYWCLAMFYEYQGRAQEAESLYQKSLQIDSDDPEANLHFGLYLKEIGELAKAKAYLRRALSFDPHNEKARVILSELELPKTEDHPIEEL